MDAPSTAHEASSSSSPSSSSTGHWEYDVFLSFRGIDTRYTFADHLYEALKAFEVKVYNDNYDLRRGENIADELKQAIERARICVIVFSNRYADSRWCLDELEKIMESRRTRGGKTVLPIFYYVDPTDVRNQTGSFAEAFHTHELRFNGDGDKVQSWRSACTEAADLAGAHLKTDWPEGQFLRKILGQITRTLNNTSLHVTTNPIGIDSRVKEVSNYLHVGGSDDVRIVGILGMAGTGKTTIAKAIFNEFDQSFQGKSFLSEVRKGDMVKLQNQLLCDILKPAKIEVRSVDEGIKKIKDKLGSRKVFVIFDDIDCEELNKLAIKRESFALGSRIIVTTRNERVLKMLEVDEKYSVPLMSDEEAFQLLDCCAFTKQYPKNGDYLELLRKVVEYCEGLPLALKVLGSYLCTRTKNEWRSALKKLKKNPHGKIHEMLKISYEGLIDNEVKAIFLDISCFFIGMHKDYVKTILDGCDFDTEIGIGELHDQCLVSVDGGSNLIMHGLIRDMGREIVYEESPSIKGTRSRLWNPKDVIDVLRNESGTAEIEGVTLDLQGSDEPSFSAEALKNMQGLRLLKLKGAKFTGDCKGLSKKLRLLCWPEFPLEAIPEDFNQPNIVDIDLSHSHIQVWKDSDMPLEKLKFLNLGYCDHLKQSPNFSKLPNLEKLILRGCKSLSEIHHSILQLKTLKYLCLAYCNLTDEAIPEDLGDLSSLEVLDLRGNDFNKLPTLSGLSKLQTLQLDNCSNLTEIPDLPTKLKILQANECIALEKMPNFSEMSYMIELHLNHSPKLTDIPGLEGCTNLTAAFKEVLQMYTKSQRDVNWRPEEDEALCKGWVSVSEDGAFGTNQASDTFWKRVYQKFLENDPGISGPEQRTYQAITSRFKNINQQCSLWKACLTKANMNLQSGSNLCDVDMYAKTIFLSDNKPPNRPFTLYHAWEILKDCPKWNNLFFSTESSAAASAHQFIFYRAKQRKSRAFSFEALLPLKEINMAWKTSDAESLQSSDELKRQKKIKMAIYITIFVVFQIIVITTMSLTVMKVKTPRFRLGNINVQNFEAVPATPSFDTKFTTQIKIKNSANWGSYKFNAANVTFQYQGQTVAVINIAKGKAGWLSTIKRNAEVSLNSSAIIGSNLGSELSSGVLTLNSVGRLNGKVAIMFIMKKKKAANMNCTIAFDVTAKTLKSLQCK